ncbi:MAG TPA: DUF2853 family protein [Bacteroidetes bacterium]|nr:DUF2853 family protein [Bacteroidota bacterium]
MSKFDEKMSKYESDLKGLGKSAIDATLLKNIAKGLGPSIYLRDASMVSCSDNSELDRVRNNFAVKKLGVPLGDELDAAIKAVCEEYTSRNKLRVVFYYMLAQKLGKSV